MGQGGATSVYVRCVCACMCGAFDRVLVQYHACGAGTASNPHSWRGERERVEAQCKRERESPARGTSRASGSVQQPTYEPLGNCSVAMRTGSQISACTAAAHGYRTQRNRHVRSETRCSSAQSPTHTCTDKRSKSVTPAARFTNRKPKHHTNRTPAHSTSMPLATNAAYKLLTKGEAGPRHG